MAVIFVGPPGSRAPPTKAFRGLASSCAAADGADGEVGEPAEGERLDGEAFGMVMGATVGLVGDGPLAPLRCALMSCMSSG